MKDCKPYKVGELLWRTTDNALFEITQVDYGMICENSDNAYTLKCVNHMDVAEHVVEREPETELRVSIDMVHTKNSIYTPYQPSKLKKGQHVWNKAIIGRNKEFIVEDVRDIPGSCKEKPCKTCHDGKCEQCRWGYRSEEDIAKELAATYKKPETIYTLVGIDGREQYKVNDSIFADSWSMLPPYYEDIDKFVKSEMKSIRDASLGTDDQSETEAGDPTINSDDEAEKVMNERLEAESVATGETIENDSYTRWRDGLKVVNIPKFDLKYFIKGLAYHVNKVTSNYPGEFYGIMVEATENLLRVMKLGTHIHIESTEIIEIPLKEYLNGDWHIVRLVEEV